MRTRRRERGPVTALFLTDGAEMGGAQTVLLELLRRLDRARIRPIVVTLGEGELLESARAIGIEAAAVPRAARLASLSRRASGSLDLVASAPHVVRVAWWLGRFARARSVDVMVTNSTKGGHVHGAVVGRLLGLRVIARVHDIAAPPSFNAVTRAVLGAALRTGADRVLAVSDASRRSLAALGVPERKLRVVYNGVAPRPADPARRSRVRSVLGVPADAILLASVGRLTRWKGQHVLIAALPSLMRRHASLRAIVVGGSVFDTPAYRAELEDAIREHGLGDRVRMLGHRDDVPDLLAASDVLVHTSVEPDPLPTVILEAIAAGVFVVAADAGGVPEIVADPRVGALYPPGDVAALAETLDRVVTERRVPDPAVTRSILERFSMPAYVAALSEEIAGP